MSNIYFSTILLLVITTIRIYAQSVQFQIVQANTDLGACTCDLTISACDSSCCCDPDCDSYDYNAFSCSSRDNSYTNSTLFISSVQPTCYKNLSIFLSNSPYIIQKMGELVCIDYQRYTGSQYYQQPQNQTLNPTNILQTTNADNSVTAPDSLPTNNSTYKVGSSILTYNRLRSAVTYFSLPVSLLNNPVCSASQKITYMNDFVSTCTRVATSAACADTLNPSVQINQLCLVNPSTLFDNRTYVCDSTVGSTSSNSSTACNGALSSLTIKIYYSNSNSTNILRVTVAYTTTNVTYPNSLQQVFNVQFIKSVQSSSSVSVNPGYLVGSSITVATLNGTNTTLQTQSFTLVKSAADGNCNTDTTQRIPIRFGESIRSICTYSPNTTSTCSNLDSLLMPITSNLLYVAAYSNPDLTNVTTDWLLVKSCTSVIGSQDNYECTDGLQKFASTSPPCYIKLDIQIAYTNIGTVSNPQHVLSAVIFHFQRQATQTNTSYLFMESVTFQDISPAIVTIEGQIPAPNTRLPADFFYPFSSSQAAKSFTSLSVTFSLISVLFLHM